MNDRWGNDPASSRRSIWLAAALLVLAIAGSYGNTFGVPFLFDDVPSIVRNATLRNLGASLLPPPDTTVSGRPAANLTLP